MAFFSSIPSVEEVSVSDFKGHKLNNKPEGLILIYASYCGYCTMVKPEWERFGKMMKGKHVYALQGDTDKNQMLLNSLSVQGVPDIRFVGPDGKIDSVKFSGDRTAEEFKKYLTMKKKKTTTKPKKKSTKPKKKTTKSKKKSVAQKGGSSRPQKGGASKKKKVVKKKAPKKKPSKKAPKKKSVQSKKKKRTREAKKIVIKKKKVPLKKIRF